MVTNISCPKCGYACSSLETTCPLCGEDLSSAKAPTNEPDFEIFNQKPKNGKKCPSCGYVNMTDSLFCNHCGTKLESQPIQGVVCPSCGKNNLFADGKCNYCGAALVTPANNVTETAEEEEEEITANPVLEFINRIGVKKILIALAAVIVVIALIAGISKIKGNKNIVGKEVWQVSESLEKKDCEVHVSLAAIDNEYKYKLVESDVTAQDFDANAHAVIKSYSSEVSGVAEKDTIKKGCPVTLICDGSFVTFTGFDAGLYEGDKYGFEITLINNYVELIKEVTFTGKAYNEKGEELTDITVAGQKQDAYTANGQSLKIAFTAATKGAAIAKIAFTGVEIAFADENVQHFEGEISAKLEEGAPLKKEAATEAPTNAPAAPADEAIKLNKDLCADVASCTLRGTVEIGESSSLNVRDENSTSGEIVDTLSKGDSVTITEISDGWGKITSGTTEGWVRLDFISIAYTLTESVNAYTSADCSTEAFKLEKGATVYAKGISGECVIFVVNGTTGYVKFADIK